MKIAFVGRVVAAALFLGAAGAGLAVAQGNIIADRQQAMKGLGAAMGSVGPFIRNEQPFNQQTAVNAMTTVRETASKMSGWFPPGSGPAPGVTTRALPAIFTNKADFDQKAQGAMTAAANALLAAQSGNADSFRAAFGAVGQSCGACHTPYRAPQ
jgi:cytochrome c556